MLTRLAILGPDELAELARAYTRTGYVLIRQLLDPVVTSSWERRYRALPGRKVHIAGKTEALWVEQDFTDPAAVLGDWATRMVR